ICKPLLVVSCWPFVNGPLVASTEELMVADCTMGCVKWPLPTTVWTGWATWQTLGIGGRPPTARDWLWTLRT
ncbi:hypothetical protein M9458_034139, partial [Cirrhinus mrigala]